MKSVFIALKEIRLFLRDRGDLAFSLLLPVILFALIYGALGGTTHFYGTAYVVDDDQGAYSTMLLDGMAATGSLDIKLLAAEDAERRLEGSDILLALYIPPDFSRSLDSGQPAELTFRQRGNGGQEGQVVAGIIRSVAEELAQQVRVQAQVGAALATEDIPADLIQTTVQQHFASQHESPTIAVTEAPVGVKPDPVREFLPGIITMFVLFATTLNARALVEERRKGTLERLMTTSLSANQFFLGKFLAGLSRAFLQTLLLLALSYAVFRIFTPLSFLEALAISLVFAAAASALGLVIATVVRTEDAATWIAVFFTMSMTMLGGTFFAITPGSVWDAISRVSINTYANQALKEIIVHGGSLPGVWLELAVLGGVTLAAFVLSRALFRVAPGGS